MIKLDLEALSPELAEAAREVLPLLDIDEGEHGIPVVTEENAEGLTMYFSNDGSLVIGYRHLCEFFRALGKVKRIVEDGIPVKEKAHFEWLSFMADVSRGGVLHVEGAKKLIRYLALMGYNDLMLYTEDTYELPDEPYWGHQRGKYTLDELRELVSYGERFGVTLTPCIQTLGHLYTALRWDCYGAVKDTQDVLYVGKEETYELLDKIFATLCGVFKTRRFNIGMDEAHSLGTGRRLEQEGHTSRGELMALHLKRVAELCKKHGIQPLIWSDMFFRPYADDVYYSKDTVLPQSALDSVPEGFTPVYWDYYNFDKDEESRAIFDNMMAQHLRFSGPVGFAGCTWRYLGFAPNNAFSLLSSEYHATACLKNGIRDVTVTSWSNNGCEASMFSAFPAMLLYAEKLYTGNTETTDVSRPCSDIFGITVEDFILLDQPNRVPDAPGIEVSAGRNPCKYLFYNDCLCGKMDRNVSLEYKAFYAELAERLAEKQDLPRFGYLFETLASLCRVLSTKATLSVELRNAYLKKDKKALREIIDGIPPMVEELDRFIRLFRKQWMTENKLFGYEALEMRFGAVRQRALGTRELVEMYLKGEIQRIEPLEEKVLYHDCRPDDSPRNKVATVENYFDCVPVTFALR